MFVIRKYIKARTAREALEKERNVEADEVWVDEKFHDELVVRGFEDK